MPRVRFIGNPMMLLIMAMFIYVFMLVRMAIWVAVMILTWAVQIVVLPAMVFSAVVAVHADRRETYGRRAPSTRAQVTLRRMVPKWLRQLARNGFTEY